MSTMELGPNLFVKSQDEHRHIGQAVVSPEYHGVVTDIANFARAAVNGLAGFLRGPKDSLTFEAVGDAEWLDDEIDQ